jgi:hypothetical protein
MIGAAVTRSIGSIGNWTAAGTKTVWPGLRATGTWASRRASPRRRAVTGTITISITVTPIPIIISSTSRAIGVTIVGTIAWLSCRCPTLNPRPTRRSGAWRCAIAGVARRFAPIARIVGVILVTILRYPTRAVAVAVLRWGCGLRRWRTRLPVTVSSLCASIGGGIVRGGRFRRFATRLIATASVARGIPWRGRTSPSFCGDRWPLRIATTAGIASWRIIAP